MKYSLESNDVAYNIAWNIDGSILGSICKDKVLRLADPRTEKFA